MRRANTEVSRAARNALDGVEIEGLRLSWNDMLERWELKDPTTTSRDGLVCSSKTLEGLDQRLEARRKAKKKQPFKREKVIVFQRHSEPYVGTVTSRPSQYEIWVVLDTEQHGKSKERIRIGESTQYGGAEVYRYEEKVFETLCNLKMAEAEMKRRKALALKGLAASLTKFEPNAKDHPVLE